jgi:hypothetical protein
MEWKVEGRGWDRLAVAEGRRDEEEDRSALVASLPHPTMGSLARCIGPEAQTRH